MTLMERFLLSVGAVAVFGSLIVTLAPESPARPLVAAGGWTASGAFVPTKPASDAQVRRSIIDAPEAMFWRSWSPAKGPGPGRVETVWFTPSRHMAIPFAERAYDGTHSIRLECQTGGSSTITRGKTIVSWAEVIFSLPKNICSGQVRLVAEDAGGDFMGVGTPFAVSGLSVMKQHFAGMFAALVESFTVFAVVALAGALLFRRAGMRLHTVPAGFITLGFVGIGLFFLGRALDPKTNRIVFPMLLAVALGVVGVAAHFHRKTFRNVCSEAACYALVWFAVAAFSTANLYLVTDNIGGSWAANGRFWPASWSSDNQIPMIVAENIFTHHDTLVMGSWHVSDRPPLLSGLMALARSTWWMLPDRSVDGSYRAQFYIVSAILLTASWAPAVVYLCRSAGLSHGEVSVVTTAALLTPFTIFNTVFTWPKLLSGAFGLLAFTQLRQISADGGQRSHRTTLFATAAALAAMALLSHGSAFFGFLAMVPWLLVTRRLPRPKELAIAILAAALLLGPWMIWQRVADPPGNALVKYAFAGTFGFDAPQESVVDATINAYRHSSLADWWMRKRDGFATMLGAPVYRCGVAEMGSYAADSFSLATLRVDSFLGVFPSLGLLSFGLVALAERVIVRLRGARFSYLGPAAEFTGIGLLAIGLETLLTWDCLSTHYHAYETLLLLMIGLTVALVRSGWPGRMTIAASMSLGTLAWVVGPLFDMRPVDPIAAVGMVWALLVGAQAILRRRWSMDEAEGDSRC